VVVRLKPVVTRGSVGVTLVITTDRGYRARTEKPRVVGRRPASPSSLVPRRGRSPEDPRRAPDPGRRLDGPVLQIRVGRPRGDRQRLDQQGRRREREQARDDERGRVAGDPRHDADERRSEHATQAGRRRPEAEKGRLPPRGDRVPDERDRRDVHRGEARGEGDQ
jgi:hypothetical protein